MQPLDADIELKGTDNLAIENLHVDIGDEEDFRRLGISWDELPVQIKLKTQRKNGHWIIHVSSPTPVQQPYLQFPLKIRNGKLKLVKTITFLLDPDERQVRTAAYPRPATHRPASKSKVKGPQPIFDANGRKVAPNIRTYRVKPGETLWPIAYYLRSEDVTSQQMMIALQRMNPNAFKDGNINKLITGSVLRVPTTEQVRRINLGEALSDFHRQEQAWKKGEPLPPPPPVENSSHATSQTDLQILEAEVERTLAPQQTQAKLQVLPAKAGAEDARRPEKNREQIVTDILRTQEQIGSHEIEQSNLRLQISGLQTQVRQMKALLKLKDRQIATLQAIIDARKTLDEGASPEKTAAIEDTKSTRSDIGLGPPHPSDTPEPDHQNTGWRKINRPSGNHVQRETAPKVRKTQLQPDIENRHPPRVRQTRQDSKESDSLFALDWLWLPLGGGLVLLLAIILRRRGNEDPLPEDDVPLAIHPEVAKAGSRPYSESEDNTDAGEHLVESGATEMLDQVVPEPPPESREEDGKSFAEEPLTQEISIDSLPEEPTSTPEPTQGLDELPELDEILTANGASLDIDNESGQDNIVGFWNQINIPENHADDDHSLLQEVETDTDEDQSLDIVLEMARAYVELGDKEEALSILDQALSSADTLEKRERIQAVIEEIS